MSYFAARKATSIAVFRMKDGIGADVTRVLPQLETYDFTFLIEDQATVWNLGPQRYPEIAKRYEPLTQHAGKLAIDINIVDRYQDVYPTKQQTGTELFQLVDLASTAFPRGDGRADRRDRACLLAPACSRLQ